MMVKFLDRGTGSARAAADYLTAHLDAKGKEREEVQVLRGDPHQVADVADSLEFEHKYTAGLFAWAPEDQPSDWQIDKVLEEFEKTAWAGLEPDRYAWSAVEHRDGRGGVHVHVLAARVDLESGKSLNIAPPGWEKTYGALRDWQNHENNWSRPDDPARARLQQPGHRAYIEAGRLRAGLAVEADPRSAIRDYLLQRVEQGEVRDRAGVVAALQEAGLEVPRQGKNYITAADPDSGGRWRLKGAIYERDFQHERLTSPPSEEGRAGPATNRDGDPERAEEALRELESHRRERAVYHRARYESLEKAVEHGSTQSMGGTDRGRPVDLSGHLRRELGVDAVVVEQRREPHRGADRDPSGDRAGTADPGSASGTDVGRVAARGGGRGEARSSAPGDVRRLAVDRARAACHQAIQRVKELYDRARETLDGRLEGAIGAVGSGSGATTRKRQFYARLDEGSEAVGQRLREASRATLERLAGAGAAVRKAGGYLDEAIRTHHSGLQGDRRSVEKGLNRIRQIIQRRQRGPERDYGPSR